jgi:cytochrome c5
MKKITVALALFSCALVAQTSDDKSQDELKARIAPVGQVYLAGAVVADTGPKEPRTGEQVYNAACFACHAPGNALGAPGKQTADWKPRLAQGLEVLHKHAIEGIRTMPPRGTCADCSDDEILAAIKFMTEGV